MNPFLIIVGVLMVVGVVFLVVQFFRSLAEERARTAEAEARRLQLLLDEVKEVAWEHRDIAPELSTIIIDTIRTDENQHRRRQLP